MLSKSRFSRRLHRINSTEEFRGYQASKKRYFLGKIHLMVTQDGQPVDVC